MFQPCHFVIGQRGPEAEVSHLKSLSIRFLGILGHSPQGQLNVTLSQRVTLAIATLCICCNLINLGHSNHWSESWSKLWGQISHFKEEESWAQDMAELEMEFCFLGACWQIYTKILDTMLLLLIIIIKYVHTYKFQIMALGLYMQKDWWWRHMSNREWWGLCMQESTCPGRQRWNSDFSKFDKVQIQVH